MCVCVVLSVEEEVLKAVLYFIYNDTCPCIDSEYCVCVWCVCVVLSVEEEVLKAVLYFIYTDTCPCIDSEYCHY